MISTVTLTMAQRLNLDVLLSVQRGSLGDLFALHDVRKKIGVPEKERSLFIRSFPDGRVVVDEQAVAAAAPVEVEFESEEVRRVLRLFREWTNFTEGDLDWLIPLKKQLEGLEQ